jgi:chromate transporter
MEDNTLLSLSIFFSLISLVSIGGGNTVIPDIQREAVITQHWLSNSEFAAAFAIARVAPGPGSLIVTLIGWKAAGWIGAIVATLAMYIPTSILAYFTGRIWRKLGNHPYRAHIEKGLAPITLGLLFASGWIIAQQTIHHLISYAIIAVTVWIVAKTKINPLLLMLLAATAGTVISF